MGFIESLLVEYDSSRTSVAMGRMYIASVVNE